MSSDEDLSYISDKIKAVKQTSNGPYRCILDKSEVSVKNYSISLPKLLLMDL